MSRLNHPGVLVGQQKVLGSGKQQLDGFFCCVFAVFLSNIIRSIPDMKVVHISISRRSANRLGFTKSLFGEIFHQSVSINGRLDGIFSGLAYSWSQMSVRFFFFPLPDVDKWLSPFFPAFPACLIAFSVSKLHQWKQFHNHLLVWSAFKKCLWHFSVGGGLQGKSWQIWMLEIVSQTNTNTNYNTNTEWEGNVDFIKFKLSKEFFMKSTLAADNELY